MARPTVSRGGAGRTAGGRGVGDGQQRLVDLLGRGARRGLPRHAPRDQRVHPRRALLGHPVPACAPFPTVRGHLPPGSKIWQRGGCEK